MYGALAGGIGPDLVPAGTRDAYLVLALPARQGDTGAWLNFDKDTGALLRREYDNSEIPHPPCENFHDNSFLQYRKVSDGTVAPFQFIGQNRATNARVRGIQMKIEDNTPIDDKVFMVLHKNS